MYNNSSEFLRHPHPSPIASPFNDATRDSTSVSRSEEKLLREYSFIQTHTSTHLTSLTHSSYSPTHSSNLNLTSHLLSSTMVTSPTLPSLPANTHTTRPPIPYLPLPLLNDPFILSDLGTRNYKTQYANIYYTRLLKLRPVVGKVAGERWAGTRGELAGAKRSGQAGNG